MYLQNNNNTLLYEVSKKEKSGVTIIIQNVSYYYDLKRITYYEYMKSGRLTYRITGSPKLEKISGKLAKQLYAALTDWHKGEIQ